MRPLKKALSILICFAICLLLPVSCGEKQQNPSAAEISERLKALSSEDITWVEISSNKLSSYFGFGPESVEDFKGYINDSEDSYDIIAVFKTENRQEIITGINHLVAEQENTYKVASENVFTKISRKIIAEKDDIIVFCIIDGYDKANKYLTDTLKAKIIS